MVLLLSTGHATPPAPLLNPGWVGGRRHVGDQSCLVAPSPHVWQTLLGPGSLSIRVRGRDMIWDGCK